MDSHKVLLKQQWFFGVSNHEINGEPGILRKEDLDLLSRNWECMAWDWRSGQGWCVWGSIDRHIWQSHGSRLAYIPRFRGFTQFGKINKSPDQQSQEAKHRSGISPPPNDIELHVLDLDAHQQEINLPLPEFKGSVVVSLPELGPTMAPTHE